MNFLKELSESLWKLLSPSVHLDSLLVPLPDAVGRISARDIYSLSDSKLLIAHIDSLAFSGDCTSDGDQRWELVEDINEFDEGKVIVVNKGDPFPPESTFWIKKNLVHEGRRIIDFTMIAGEVNYLPQDTEGILIQRAGKIITLESISKMALSGIINVWIQEKPNVYLILQDLGIYTFPYKALISQLASSNSCKLVEIISVKSSYSMLRSAIASTFPDADLIIIAGAMSANQERYNSEHGIVPHLTFNDGLMSLSTIEDTPAIWMEINLDSCLRVCPLVVSSIMHILQKSRLPYQVSSSRSLITREGNHNGLIIAVERIDDAVKLPSKSGRIYGYIILRPAQALNAGDMVDVYTIGSV